MARRSRGAVWPLLGLVLGASLHPAGARAAEALPGGALDITISGFARFLAGYGDIGGIGSILNRSGDQVLNNYDFFNDTEVHIVARGVHDATGIEYGGTIEFNADTNRTDNTDETWVFVRGAPGELRFGDTNSAATRWPSAPAASTGSWSTCPRP
jgi:outer membrane protein OmpU